MLLRSAVHNTAQKLLLHCHRRTVVPGCVAARRCASSHTFGLQLTRIKPKHVATARCTTYASGVPTNSASSVSVSITVATHVSSPFRVQSATLAGFHRCASQMKISMCQSLSVFARGTIIGEKNQHVSSSPMRYLSSSSAVASASISSESSSTSSRSSDSDGDSATVAVTLDEDIELAVEKQDSASYAEHLQTAVAHVTKMMSDLKPKHIENTIELLEADNSVPFITRYRKEAHGGMEENVIRDIKSEYSKFLALSERRVAVKDLLRKQENLSADIEKALDDATQLKDIEDIYLPFRPKRRTLASSAREAGFGPIADAIWDGTLTAAADYDAKLDELLTSDIAPFVDMQREKALQESRKAIMHIIAEHIANSPKPRDTLRTLLRDSGQLEVRATSQALDSVHVDETDSEDELGADLASFYDLDEDDDGSNNKKTKTAKKKKTKKAAAKKKKAPQKTKKTTFHADAGTFQHYFEFDSPIARIRPHQLLAINRGESVKYLRVKITLDPALVEQALFDATQHQRSNNSTGAGTEIGLSNADTFVSALLKESVADAYDRLLLSSMSTELRRELTEAAELEAVKVFGNNLRTLLLTPPIRDRVVLGIDPSFRTGWYVC
jgi:Tex-like protein N-terminal domain/Tex central region-like